MMDSLLSFAQVLSDKILWGPWTLVLIALVAILLSVRSRFFQFRQFGFIMRNTCGKILNKTEDRHGMLSPFQATATALASTIGTGNIAGVAAAISIGGPGAIFWMWVMALFGMISKTAEVALAVHYREFDKAGILRGGPMHYMNKGLGWNFLSKVFCIGLIINALLTAALLQPHTVGRAFLSSYGFNPYIVAIIMAVITGSVIIGGLKRIGLFCEFLTPIMALVYSVAAIAIIIVKFDQIPYVLSMIFTYAFKPMAAIGGFTGSIVATAIQKGVSRGMMSNEAGQGTAPMAHAVANVDHPVRQGLWGAFEVFVDTIIVCSMTAFVVLSTGAFQSGKSGVEMVLTGFDSVFPGNIASLLLSFAIFTFCLSSQIGFYIYFETCVSTLMGEKGIKVFRWIYLVPGILCAGISNVDNLWLVADIATGCTSIPNLIAVLALNGVFIKLLKDFESGEMRYATSITDVSHRYIRESKAYSVRMSKSV